MPPSHLRKGGSQTHVRQQAQLLDMMKRGQIGNGWVCGAGDKLRLCQKSIELGQCLSNQ
jgi:hypothetical protein